MNKQKIQELLGEALAEHPELEMFEVSVSISPSNEIKVYVDGMKGVGIDQCVEISRYIESHLDRDVEDFELTVSSAGLDQPFRVPAQYVKNIGKEVKVVCKGGGTFKGVILEADQDGFVLEEAEKKSSRLAKKKVADEEGNVAVEQDRRKHFDYQDVKETKIVISFK